MICSPRRGEGESGVGMLGGDSMPCEHSERESEKEASKQASCSVGDKTAG